MILKNAPRLFYLAIARHNWRLLALTLDLVVPPLSLLGILVVGVFTWATLVSGIVWPVSCGPYE